MSDVTTGASSITSVYLTDFLSREVGESLQATAVIAPHVWLEKADASLTVKFGFMPVLAAASYTDTVGMPLDVFQPTSATCTIAPVGTTVRVTGLASALRPQIVSEAGNEQGRAIGTKLDTDLAALFPSFTTNYGTSGAAITVANWLSAIGKLNANKVPSNDRIGFLSPTQYSDFLAALQSSNQFAWSQAAATGQIPAPFGVPVAMSQTLATANSAADSVGCMMQRRAIGLGLLQEVRTRIQDAPVQFDATDIGASIYYGAALLDAVRGIRLTTRV